MRAPCSPLAQLLLLMASILASTPASAAAADRDAGSHRGWPVYGGDAAGSKYSPLSQINRDNVAQLKPAWVYRCDDMSGRPASTIECNPIVVGGTVYLTSPGLKLLALDAATGDERWRFAPGSDQRRRGVNRGVTYWSDGGDDRRIFFVMGPQLHAVNAANGQPIRGFGTDGRIDLRDGLDRDVFFLSVSATSPGIVYRDLLILGSIVGEGPGAAAPGHIRAFDVRTGERKWIFHTIPHPGELGYETWPSDAWKTAGGANCWGGMTLDSARGIVFAGTGSASYDHFGGDRAGENLFANCVLAMRAATGERVWHFQVVHHDIWDYDIPCPPNLVTVEHGGRRIDAVAQVTKTGHTFVLDRETGEPLFPVEGFPANQRPWGTLTAIDLDRGEFRWQVPLGTYPELEKRGVPPTGTFNIGGSLVTAGGLVFLGATMDERFHAFDKATGKLLWEFQLDAGGYATPATYEIGGRQFVLIAAGGGGKPGTRPGNAYYCFALPAAPREPVMTSLDRTRW